MSKVRANFKLVAASKFGEIYATREKYDFPVTIMQHGTYHINPIAEFALRCIERWAVVAAIPEGEDSEGRQKLGMMPPNQVVSHAFACAEEAFRVIEERGHRLCVDSYTKLVDDVKNMEDSNS